MQKKSKKQVTLPERYPPSAPCSCDVCRNYCKRPGWWTIEEAEHAIDAGFAGRMMLELAPDRSFGVLSPAFKGNEGLFALDIFSDRGCTFYANERCELFNSGVQPLECRFCHHSRKGLGLKCHLDIESQWRSRKGQAVVERWTKLTKLFERINR